MWRMLSALMIAVLVGAGTLIGSPAHAASAPEVIDAGTTSVPGVVSVHIRTEAGVASVVAHIFDATVEPAVEVATVTSFYLAWGTESDGYWHANDALRIPLGNYRVDVEVTDNNGVHVSKQSAGWLWVYAQLSFADVKVTGKVTYANRQITVSGRVLGTWPGGIVRPVADQPVVFVSGNGSVEAVTNRDGRFRATLTIVSNEDYVYFDTGWRQDHPFYSPAHHDLGTIPVTQAPTKLTVSLDRKKILRYESVTITGRATWKSPTGWLPSPNQTVVVLLCESPGGYCPADLGYVTTDADGRFSLTAEPYQSGVIQAGTHNDDPFITTATLGSTPVTVLQRARFTDFSAYRSSPTEVYLTGHLDFYSGFTPAPIPVEIQFSRTGTGGWRTEQIIDLSYNPTHLEGIFFEHTMPSDRAGYWRVYYAGTPYFEKATSPAVSVAAGTPAT